MQGIQDEVRAEVALVFFFFSFAWHGGCCVITAPQRDIVRKIHQIGFHFGLQSS